MDVRPASIGVLGGGVAGILTALELARRGEAVTLYEARPVLGGLHTSHAVDGAVFDIGTFTFDPDHEYFTAFPGIEAHFTRVGHTNASLTPSGTLDAYPLSLRGYQRDHGTVQLVADLASILGSKWRCRHRRTLLDFIHYYVGPGLYHRSGLQHYMERLYGLPDGEIDLEFARKRLGVIAEKCSLRANAHQVAIRTLRDQRVIPWSCRVRGTAGFDPVYGFIAQRLRAAGVAIRTGAVLERLRSRAGGFDLTVSGRTVRHDRVVSTIPMEAAAVLLGTTLPIALPYMSLVSLFYRFEGEHGFDTHCLYNFTLDGPWKRLTLFSAYYGPSRGEHYFTVECTVEPGGEAPVDELAEGFESHVGRMPILRGRMRRVGAAVTPNAYPVYRRGAGDRLARCRAVLEEAGLELAGRQGRFDYASSKDVARESRERVLAAAFGTPR